MEISRITCGNHTGFMKQFLKYMDLKHKSIHIARINTQHIKDYVIFRRKQRLSENTIRNDLTYIKTFFKWCFREKYLVGNPYNHEIKMPQYQPRTISHIPVGKEWDILYQFISKSLTFVPTTQNEKRKWTWFNKNIDFKEQIFLMLNTGMRGGEVQILKWKKGDLDYGKPTFPYSHLNRGNKTATIYFKRTLTTDFEFNTATIKMLRNRLDRKHPQDTYVFSNPNTNTRYNNSQLVDSFNRLCEGLGLVDKETQKSLFTPHSLRHGVISQLLRTGVPIQDISKVVARHSKIGTTYDIYGHFQTGKGKSILDSLSNDKDKL
jgi:integrase